MGILSNRVEKEELKGGDHIYTYRAVFAYSHHGMQCNASLVLAYSYMIILISVSFNSIVLTVVGFLSNCLCLK